MDPGLQNIAFNILSVNMSSGLTLLVFNFADAFMRFTQVYAVFILTLTLSARSFISKSLLSAELDMYIALSQKWYIFLSCKSTKQLSK